MENENKKLADNEEIPDDVVEEETEGSKVDQLLDEGYTPVQLEKEWGFPHATVYMRAKKRLSPKGQPKGENGEAYTGRLPTVLKAGAGQEVISPEAILQHYQLADGQAGDWILKGMMLLRAAQMMVLTDVEIMKGQADAQSKAIKPILDIMEQSRKDMDAAAQRARESNLEIADRAAYEAAMEVGSRIGPEIQSLKSSIGTQAGDPITRALSAMQSAQQLMGMFGFPFGQIAAPGQPTPGQQPWEPPPIERRSIKEKEEKEDV